MLVLSVAVWPSMLSVVMLNVVYGEWCLFIFWGNDTQLNDIQYNNKKCNTLQMKLIAYAERRYAECRAACLFSGATALAH
jgi:hypothetical protein